MKRYGRPGTIVTDQLRSYRSAMKVIGNAAGQVCGRWLNNRAENSHQPFRRRKGAMAKFRDIKTLQKFAPAHASFHNHFNHDRHLNRLDLFNHNRSAALAEWRQLAALPWRCLAMWRLVRIRLTAPLNGLTPNEFAAQRAGSFELDEGSAISPVAYPAQLSQNQNGLSL